MKNYWDPLLKFWTFLSLWGGKNYGWQPTIALLFLVILKSLISRFSGSIKNAIPSSKHYWHSAFQFKNNFVNNEFNFWIKLCPRDLLTCFFMKIRWLQLLWRRKNGRHTELLLLTRNKIWAFFLEEEKLRKCTSNHQPKTLQFPFYLWLSINW